MTRADDRVADRAAGQGGEQDPGPAMFDLITGYWRSQVIGAAARLRITDAVADGPRTAAQIAQALDLHAGATARLLSALAALGVVRRSGDQFSLTPLGATLRSVPGSMRDYAVAELARGHWLPWGEIDDVIRTGDRAPPRILGQELWEYYGQQPEEAEAFSGAMSGLSAMVAGDLVASGLVPPGRTVIDIGGAHGILVRAVLEADPTARGILFDLPHVAPTARAEIEAAGLGGRCAVVGGDFFADVPEGDVYLVKHILHDWDDAQCVAILKNCARRMRPGGSVIVVEMVVPEEDRLTPARMMDMNMLVMLPGRERTEAEYSGLFEAAGLKLAETRPSRLEFRMMRAVAA